jgi:hypothetical protein
MLDRARRLVVFPATFAALALLFVGGLLSCMEGKREATPNCVFIEASVENPVLCSPSPCSPAEDTVALVYNTDASTDINPVFDVVVYGLLTNVYNIAFDLQYDPAILQFQWASEGTAFDDADCGGYCTDLQLDSTTEEGKLLVSLTRLVPSCADCDDCADCADCADLVGGGPAVDCANSIDDDGDGWIDEVDCSNGSDDDGDGSIDEFDCTNDADDDRDGSTDEAYCINVIDDDGDGSIDEADCINGIDDDGDGSIDETACADCADLVGGGPDADCVNGDDDDGDGSIDEADCGNGSDDDGDGSVDEIGRGVDFDAEENVVMTLGFGPTAESDSTPFGFVAGTLELKDAGGPGDPPAPSPMDIPVPGGWLAGSIATREECL